MITGVHAVGLRVSDVERTADALGRAIALKRLDAPGAWLARGPNVHLELSAAWSDAPPRAVHDAGITHLCLQGREITALRTALEAGDARFLSEPVDLGTGFLYAYGRDRDGLLLETEGAPFAPVEPASWFGHIALVTPDLKRLSGFYAALTGLPQARAARLRGDAKYDAVTGLPDVDVRATWVPGLNLSLEFWRYLNPATEWSPLVEGAPAYTHVTFESDAVAADFERALALGATPETPPSAVASGERAVVRDPDGNEVRLVRWADPALSNRALLHPDILERVRLAREAVPA